MEKKFGKLENVGYTNNELRDLLKKAWDAEVAEKEVGAGRALSEEEKKEIKITREFIKRWHDMSLIPSLTTFESHFGSIIHLANLLDLPASKNKPLEYYHESERGDYMRILRAYIKEHKPTRSQLRHAISRSEIPGIPTRIFHYFDVFNSLGM